MTRATLARIVAVLLLAAGGWWLTENTEWVVDTTPRGASGEALTNPAYATEQLLRRLGMTVEHHEALDTLPPPKARLLLLSADWALMPERAAPLKRWVEQGGHLVLPRGTAGTESTDGLTAWLPAEVVHHDLDAAKTRQAARAGTTAPAAPAAPAAASAPKPTAHSRTELVSTPRLWGDTERIVTCDDLLSAYSLSLRHRQTVDWAAWRGNQLHAVRVPMGQGSVTLLSTAPSMFFNTPALRCDTPLLVAAALQAEPGATAWVYLHEKREALLPWLWHQGWVALLAGALALVAALWRATLRFGPLQAPPPRLRRSIAEQVKGLAAWLQRGGTEALLAAQQRALDEAAARALPRYTRLPVAERARAIAEATGLPAPELVAAMLARFSTRAELLPRLHLLETARRRLP